MTLCLCVLRFSLVCDISFVLLLWGTSVHCVGRSKLQVYWIKDLDSLKIFIVFRLSIYLALWILFYEREKKHLQVVPTVSKVAEWKYSRVSCPRSVSGLEVRHPGRHHRSSRVYLYESEKTLLLLGCKQVEISDNRNGNALCVTWT